MMSTLLFSQLLSYFADGTADKIIYVFHRYLV